MNKSSSPLLHLHLHLLHFFDNEQIFIFPKKKIKIFNSLKKFKISKNSKKKKIHQSKFSIPSKNLGFPKFFKKTKKFKSPKKKSSLNSSSGTESYDSFPHSPVMQHQVNCPPSAFIEAWSMSQTRGIRQVCRSLFNEYLCY